MEKNNICKFNINRSGDISCTDFVYEANNAQSAERVGACHLLGLVTEGEGVLFQGGREYALLKGCLFAVLRGERFFVRGAGLAYCYISFSGRRADEIVERMGIRPSLCVFDGLEGLCAMWMDALRMADAGNTDLLAEAVLLYSLAHLKPDCRPQSDLITKAVMLTNDRFTESDFSLSVLASELGYDAKYLSFLFKKKKGVTYTGYLRNLRIKHAIFLMEQGVVSVKNIAILSGFDDALYFSKLFKQSEGISPKAYIEHLQQRPHGSS